MKIFQKIGFGIWCVTAHFLAVTTVQAADIYQPAPEGSLKDAGPADYYPAIGWSGFYLGGHLGGAWGDGDDSLANPAIFDGDGSVIGGVHFGYNWQRGSDWVFGLEGDVSFADDLDYVATIRGRLGYDFGRTLFYGTGGVAFAGFDDSVFTDDSQTGWVAGLGFDHKLRENFSLGLEGLYYGIEHDSSLAGGDDDDGFWSLRGRLTYHLNDWRPPLR